ncbi:hypothetical protein [uncultured Thiohalocapsa sp.]|uniref:hypothetical protein n=1 Tax=uncultured Thiohalocapsa sp. TaxID=768990 RepID=UPI0025E53832|nr:hypothetical protein [uncultured Thiohalocapsa sp.]
MRATTASTLALLIAAGLTPLPAAAAEPPAAEPKSQAAAAPGERPHTERSAQQGEHRSFSGLVMHLRAVRVDAGGEPRLLGRVLLDNGHRVLADFGTMSAQADAGKDRADRPQVQPGQRIAGTASLERRGGPPRLVVEQWRLVGHRSDAGHPVMFGHPQVPGHQGMAMNPSRPNRPGPVQHPSWVQQPGMGSGPEMSRGGRPTVPASDGRALSRGLTGDMSRHTAPGMGPGMMSARPDPSGRRSAADRQGTAGDAASAGSRGTDMKVMLTGTVVSIGGDGTEQAPDKPGNVQESAEQQPGAPRRIGVATPGGREVLADLGRSQAARALSLERGDQVVLYGNAGMDDGRPVLMTHYAAKLVTLPRTHGQDQGDGESASATETDPRRNTPRARITGSSS